MHLLPCELLVHTYTNARGDHTYNMQMACTLQSNSRHTMHSWHHTCGSIPTLGSTHQPGLSRDFFLKIVHQGKRCTLRLLT